MRNSFTVLLPSRVTRVWLASLCTTSPTPPGRGSRSTWRTSTCSRSTGDKEWVPRWTLHCQCANVLFKGQKSEAVSCHIWVNCGPFYQFNIWHFASFSNTLTPDPITYCFSIMYCVNTVHCLSSGRLWCETPWQWAAPAATSRCWTGTRPASSTTSGRAPWTSPTRRAGSHLGWPRVSWKISWVNNPSHLYFLWAFKWVKEEDSQ